MTAPAVDWSKRPTLHECHCRCGVVFTSRAKPMSHPTKGTLTHVLTQQPCPGCGKNDDCSETYSP